MKQRFFVLGVLLVCFAATGMAAVQPQITVETVSPQPAAPGETITIELVVSNQGTDAGMFNPLELETIGEVSVLGSTATFENPFRLCGGCQQVGKIYLRVSEEAVSGTYPVSIRHGTDSLSVTQRTEVRVDGTPTLLVDHSSPTIVPGETARYNLSVQNVGTDDAVEVVVTPEADGLATSPGQFSFDRVRAGETATREVWLQADSDLDDGLQPITYTVAYRDDADDLSSEKRLHVRVLRKARLALSDVSIDAARVGKDSPLRVELENLGPGPAEEIDARLSCDGADVGTARSFVGQIDDGESVPLVFIISPTRERISCDVSATYTDSSEQTLSRSFSVSARSNSSMQNVLYAVIGLAVLGGAVYLWRRSDEEAEI